MEETGVIDETDPLGGGWYIEALTDRVEAEAEQDLHRNAGTWPQKRVSLRIHPVGEMTSGHTCAASRTATSPARSPTPPSPTRSQE